MTDLLQEFCDSRGVALRVDRTTGVIRGIKILGMHSRNGREYLPESLARTVSLYEGAKVNVNHPKGNPLAPRDYQERMGVVRNVQHRAGEGLFADFHFNPKHYLSEQLIWDAEHAPESVGFSHNVQARTTRQGETTRVEEIVRVHSVDLVADPATTRGLFESAAANEGAANDRVVAGHFASQSGEPTQETAPLQEESDRLHAAAVIEARRATIFSLLAEFRLPRPTATDALSQKLIGEAFMQSLLAAPDEQTVRALVEERANLIESAGRWSAERTPANRKPISRDQALVVPTVPVDGRSFARAITA